MLYNEENERRDRARTVSELLGDSPISSELKRLAAKHEAFAARLSDQIDNNKDRPALEDSMTPSKLSPLGYE